VTHLVEATIDRVEALIDPVESLVDVSGEIIDSLIGPSRAHHGPNVLPSRSDFTVRHREFALRWTAA
jgi:hypothetical protein